MKGYQEGTEGDYKGGVETSPPESPLSHQQLAGNWSEAARQLGEAVPAGLGLALTGILNAQLSPEAKARIVFLRWRDPLPGAEAFTKHAKDDPRVDLAALETASSPATAR